MNKIKRGIFSVVSDARFCADPFFHKTRLYITNSMTHDGIMIYRMVRAGTAERLSDQLHHNVKMHIFWELQLY